MVIATVRMAAEEFDNFVLRPENADKSLELITGEIYEVVSNWNSSQIGMLLGGFIALFVHQHRLGKVTGADGGYKVGKDRYIPDAAFVKTERLTDQYEEGYFPIAPDLAVEVISPTDSDKKLRIKIANYLQAGTVVWVVNPAEQNVEVFVPGKPVEIIGLEGKLDGGDVLPGFQIEVKAFLA